jgi:autotransporter translocation and assembly factor TamB
MLAAQAAGNKLSSLTLTDPTGTITKSGALTTPKLTVSAGTVASGQTKFVSGDSVYLAINALKIAPLTANQTVAGAGISVTLGGTVGNPTLTGSVATASYTPATEDAEGAWVNENNVVTAA